jgi:3-phosphoshikimate 1-carboxyvinyltransferase
MQAMPAMVHVPPVDSSAGSIRAVVRPPGSKSLTNRALLLAALASGESVLHGALVDADDAQRMIEALRTLGADVRLEKNRDGECTTVRVGGVGGRWKAGAGGVGLNLNNAGTATRFLAAAALVSPGPITIDGNARMRQRPIGELGDALEACGCEVEYLGEPGCPPMRVTAPALDQPLPTLEMGSTQSSQFISALLLMGPWLPGGLTIRMNGAVTSASYVQMTLGLLGRLGAQVRSAEDLRVMRVGPMDVESSNGTENGLGVGTHASRGIPAFKYDVEPDASGATYFWGAAAILANARVCVPGLGESSLQGDSDFPEMLERMGARRIVTEGGMSRVGGRDVHEEPSIEIVGPPRGVLRPIIAEMQNMPDAVMTLAAVACFATGTTVIRGVKTLRVKESDRVIATKNELTKLGVRVEFPYRGDEDQMAITPPAGGIDCSPTAPRVEFDTYDDHRMAMSMALIGLRRPNVWIRHPQCVAKTYATFWRDLGRLRTSFAGAEGANAV